MDRRTFWATKSPQAVYEAITFTHPSFAAPIRLVRDKFAPVTLAGQVFTPAPMSITTPEQRGSTQPRMVISFPRQVVGRQFKQQLALITASSSRAPIAVAYALFLGDTAAPEVTWLLYAAEQGGVNFGADQVQVTATLENVMRRSVAPIYTPEAFSGLAAV